MKTVLHLPPGIYAALRNHLLPPNGACEEAAFIFANATRAAEQCSFQFREIALLAPDDFVAQHADYLEMRDETRARLIKRAHDLGTSLIEVHSHVGPWRAAFSFSDVRGLKDTVPNMWWRLKGRPYASVVISEVSIDALAWVVSADIAVPLDEIHDGTEILRPTHTALEEWL